MYEQIASNKRRTALLFLVAFGLILVVGWGLSYFYNQPVIFIYAIVIAIIQSWVSYFYSDSISLAVAGAKQITKEQSPEYYRLVENLAITAGLPMPKIYIIEDPSPNAFATGRDAKHAAIAATTGLLGLLEKRELEGVIAHELSHIGNRDILIMTVCVTLVGTIALVSDIFMRSLWWRSSDNENRNSNGIMLLIGVVMAILAPLVGKLIQLAISRRREFLADASGAMLTRFPEGLAEALGKIEKYERPMKSANRATAHLYINEPFGVVEKKQSWLTTVFSTHPPIAERVKKLKEMEG